MDNSNLKNWLKQGLTANELADRLEAGCSNQSSGSKAQKGSNTQSMAKGTAKSSNTEGHTMVRQNPGEMIKFRPPLGTKVAAGKPTPSGTGAANTKEPREESLKGKKPDLRRDKGSIHYVPLASDFVDEEPGGRKDKNLKGMTGAQQKWYRRALLGGKSVKEALEAAKSRPKMPGNEQQRARGTLKRERSDESKTSETDSKFSKAEEKGVALRKPTYRPRPTAKKQEGEGGAKMVGILHSEHPQSVLSQEEMKEIESLLIKEMIAGWTEKIRFDAIKYQTGYILLEAADETSVNWAKKAIWKANASGKFTLKVAEGEELPQQKLITMFLPRAETLSREEILKLIEVSNDLDTGRWRVIKEGAVEGKGKTLRALVDEQQQNKIAELKHEIRFLFSKVNVYGLRSSEGGANSGKDPEEDAPKDNEEDKGEEGDAVPTTPYNSTEEREEDMETGEEDPMSQNPPPEEEEDLLDEETLLEEEVLLQEDRKEDGESEPPEGTDP